MKDTAGRVVNGAITANRYKDGVGCRFVNQKASGVASVRLIDNDIVTGLGDRPGVDMTARLLLALTALYVQRPTHTTEEEQQYVELALRLVDKVDTSTRTAVADILQRHPNAPAEVLERLGILSSHQGSLEGKPHTQREDLARTQGLTVTNLPSMRASSEAMPAAPAPAALAPDFGEAFFAASPVERRRLLSLMKPSSDSGVHAARKQGEHVFASLDVAVLHGRIGEFNREFERLIDIPKSLCERILNDPSGEPMVIAAKATGMPIAILQRILLLVNPAVSHSVQRVYDLMDLYHGLDRGAARDLLAQWRAQATPNDPVPEPGHVAGDRKPGALRDTSVASLRSLFGALTERLQAVNARSDRGNVVRRGLRSR